MHKCYFNKNINWITTVNFFVEKYFILKSKFFSKAGKKRTEITETQIYFFDCEKSLEEKEINFQKKYLSNNIRCNTNENKSFVIISIFFKNRIIRAN